MKIAIMKSYTENVHRELLAKLEELDRNYDPQKLSDTRLGMITDSIDQIKEKLKDYSFASEAEEIHYFKWVLPETLSLYIYYSVRVEWDRIRHQGSQESNYSFMEKTYSKAENFRSRYKEFYEYTRDEKKSLDRFYFLRNSPGNQEGFYPLRSIIDRNSPTIYCAMKARLLAYTRLEQELHRAVSENSEDHPRVEADAPALLWTLSKANLTELIYALYEAGAVNEGKAGLIEIQKCFEKMFSINIGNMSRTFQELLSRKKGHTSFLDQLKIHLSKKIAGLDEKNLNENVRHQQRSI